ncbi:hypothetical protein V8C44DRAFT_175243 [Trichoderma aethiopicum]
MEASECMRQPAEVASEPPFTPLCLQYLRLGTVRCLAIAYTYLTMSECANHHSSLHELKPGVGHKPIDCISPRPLGSSTYSHHTRRSQSTKDRASVSSHCIVLQNQSRRLPARVSNPPPPCSP